MGCTLGAFVFAPELRRLADWRGNFDPINGFSILPLLMLVPVAYFVYRRRERLIGSTFFKLAALWTVAFTYAFVVGVAQKTIVPGIYGFALFVLPVAVGAWLLVQPEPLAETFGRFSRDLLIIGALAGSYGVVQFVAAPPWDTAWMQNIGATAFGRPERFGIRVFSTMNSPGTYAEFTTFALLLNLPNLRLRRIWPVLAAAIMIVALVLTLVRSAWLGFVLGAIAYAIFSPRRKAALATLGTVAFAFVALAAGFFALFPSDEVRQTLSDRVQTLTGVADDGSTVAREETSAVALAIGLARPLGHGLGVTGPPAALLSPAVVAQSDLPATPIDNGYLSRLVEMGVPGLAALLTFIGFALVSTFRSLRDAMRRGRSADAAIAAAALATQIALATVLVSGDVYSGIGSAMLFAALGLGVSARRADARAPAVVRAREPRLGARRARTAVD